MHLRLGDVMRRLILLPSLLMTIPFLCSADLGDKLYVTATTANLRDKPTISSSVIITLATGHKLTEISRQGSWINVASYSPYKIGWINSSLVETLPTVDDTPKSDVSWINWWIIAALVAYFLPSGVAFSRKHHNRDSVLVINLFLGWTFIGWVVALAMAASAVKQPPAQDASIDRYT